MALTADDNPLTTLTLTDLRSRTSMKWQRYGPEVLPLWVAEMDVTPASAVHDAMVTAVASGDLGYPWPRTYLESLSEFASTRWSWDISAGRMAAASNVITGATDIISAATAPSAPVIINVPVYPPFFSSVIAAGRSIVEAPLGDDGRLDLDVLDDAFQRAGDGAAYLLCSPHNPTGTVHTRHELEQVAALAVRRGIVVVADEIHAPLVYSESTFVPYLDVDGTDLGFSVMSASKAWNLAAVPSAIVIAGQGAMPVLMRYRAQAQHGPTHLGVVAQTTAYRHGSAWLDSLLGGLQANRDLLGNLIGEHLGGVRHRPPEATYLAWLDCRDLGLGDTPSAHFLEHAKVALNSGPSFGTGGIGHVRLNFATHPDVLTEAVRRMGASTSPA